MRTVTIGVSGIAEVHALSSAAFRGEPQGAFISFASVELLWTVMTPRRWESRRASVGRDAGSDLHALRMAGVIETEPEERISFPFDPVQNGVRSKTASGPSRRQAQVGVTMGRAA